MDNHTEDLEKLWGMVIELMNPEEKTELNKLQMAVWKNPHEDASQKAFAVFMKDTFEKYLPDEFKNLIE